MPGAPPTYHESGHCGDGIRHLYAWTLGAKRLGPKAAINIVVTPFHWIIAINVRVNAAPREEPHADLTWMLHRPCLPAPIEVPRPLPTGPHRIASVVAGAGSP